MKKVVYVLSIAVVLAAAQLFVGHCFNQSTAFAAQANHKWVCTMCGYVTYTYSRSAFPGFLGDNAGKCPASSNGMHTYSYQGQE